MPLAIFTEVGSLGDEHFDDRPEFELRYAGGRNEQAIETADRDFRVWTIEFRRSRAGMQTIDAFLRANATFLYKDTDDFARTGVSLLGDTDGVNTTFTLPVAGDEGGDYPIDDGNVVVYDDATPVTVNTTDTDDREFVLAAAPADPSVMTADYHFYRLVKATQRIRWRRIAATHYFRGTLELREVPA